MADEFLLRHSAGPWSARYVERNEPVIIQAEAGGAGGIEIARVTVRGGEERANARLIAAAPDLLAACEALTAVMQRYADSNAPQLLAPGDCLYNFETVETSPC